MKLLQRVFLVGISDGIVKGICKVIPITLPRYRDLKSQQFVRNLIKALIEQHPEWSIKHLSTVILEVAQQQKNIVATLVTYFVVCYTVEFKTFFLRTNTAQTALYALKWSCLVYSVGSSKNEKTVKAEISKIIEAQALLLTCVVSASNAKLLNKAYKLVLIILLVLNEFLKLILFQLEDVWNKIKDSEKLYLDILKSLEQNQCNIILAAALAKRLTALNNINLFSEYVVGIPMHS